MNTKDIKDRVNTLTNKITKLTAHLANHKKDKGVVRAIKRASNTRRKLMQLQATRAKDTMKENE